MNRTQDTTRLPGMWPVFVDLKSGFGMDDNAFTINGGSDSAYEYLGKMHMLLGGAEPTYELMHRKAMKTIKENVLFRPMMPDGSPDILFPGAAYANRDKTDLQPVVQHLGCFSGGYVRGGGRLFGIDEDVKVGEQLARGCGWAYSVFPTGVMPEQSYLIDCKSRDLSLVRTTKPACHRSNAAAICRNPSSPSATGAMCFVRRPSRAYSFLYRVTGKRDLQEIAWNMFVSIRKATETPLGVLFHQEYPGYWADREI